MMKLQDQCCLPEQAKRLKELGVKQAGVFSWFEDPDTCAPAVFSNASKYHCPFCCNEVPAGYEEFNAFTVAELSALLPHYYSSWRFEHEGQTKWIATIIGECKEITLSPDKDFRDIRTTPAFDRFGDTQAEALATLLIALLDTGAVTADELNARL